MNVKIYSISFILLFVYSCGPSVPYLDSRKAYHDCSLRNESVVKVDECARSKIRNHQSQYGSHAISNYNTETLNYYRGLVHKVKTKQISNSVAKQRFQSYTIQKENAKREEIRKFGTAMDELNCLLYNVCR